MIEIGSKIWLEKNGEKIFGKGPALLLLKVDELGSIRKAAFAMDMSYTKAWRLIVNLEEALGTPILEKRIGGADGGSSTLTAEAKALVERYTRMESEISHAMDLIFRKHFKDPETEKPE